MTLGQSFTCSLNVAADLTAGGIFCWGANDSGQLGAESTENCGSSPCSTAPVAVTLAGAPAASSAPTRLVSAAMSLATFAGHVDPENTEPRAAAVKMERSGSRRPNRILSRQ
jgi:hypothetical protein